MLDLRELRNFVTIVEEGSITAAAKKLNMSQPPLSRQMSQLEDGLGVQLFERGRRQIRLTGAGRLLHARSREILGLTDKTVKEVSALNSGVAGEITIGTITTNAAAHLSNWIRKYRETFPDVTFRLMGGDSYRIIDLLDKGVVEIGLVRTPFNESEYDTILLPNEPLTIIMNPSCFKVGKNPDSIELSELGSVPLILPSRYESRFLSYCEKIGFRPNILCVSDDVVHDLIWTREGIAVALEPLTAQKILRDENLVCKTIVEPELSSNAAVITVKGRYLSSAAQQFIKLVGQERSQVVLA
jgi:LysR family transcriptional regulator, salicylic acid-responsive activator of bsdBCD